MKNRILAFLLFVAIFVSSIPMFSFGTNALTIEDVTGGDYTDCGISYYDSKGVEYKRMLSDKIPVGYCFTRNGEIVFDETILEELYKIHISTPMLGIISEELQAKIKNGSNIEDTIDGMYNVVHSKILGSYSYETLTYVLEMLLDFKCWVEHTVEYEIFCAMAYKNPDVWLFYSYLTFINYYSAELITVSETLLDVLNSIYPINTLEEAKLIKEVMDSFTQTVIEREALFKYLADTYSTQVGFDGTDFYSVYYYLGKEVIDAFSDPATYYSVFSNDLVDCVIELWGVTENYLEFFEEFKNVLQIDDDVDFYLNKYDLMSLEPEFSIESFEDLKNSNNELLENAQNSSESPNELPVPSVAAGRQALVNTNNASGQDIISSARSWAGSGATYWSGIDPWYESVYWRTGYTCQGRTSFDCSGFVSRVLNDVGFRGAYCPNGYNVMSEKYGNNYIGISIEDLVAYGEDITSEVLAAKNGDYSGLLPGDVIGWTNNGRHVIFYAGLNAQGSPTIVEFTGNGYYDRVMPSHYPQLFQYGARFASENSNTTKLYWPVPTSAAAIGYISSAFGPRVAPTTGASTNHRGIDIPVVSGTPVYAAYDGTVVAVSQTAYRGNYVLVYHPAVGLSTLYQHLTCAVVQVGDEVSGGSQIAISGSTGIGTGPHLHFGVMVGQAQYVDQDQVGWDMAINPLGTDISYISSDGTTTTNSDNPDDYTYPTRDLFYTSPVLTGNDVKWIQAVLLKLGYDIAIDGSFGPITKNVVMQFQNDNALDVDGSCGPITRGKLLEKWNALKENPIAITDIKLNCTAIKLSVGDEFELNVAILPLDVSNKNIIWETSASDIATVSNGKVTAVGCGNATITATTENGGKVATCDVTVINHIPGDLNGDNKVNNRDAIAMINYLANGISNYDETFYDLDGSGRINNIDVSQLIRNLSGWNNKLIYVHQTSKNYVVLHFNSNGGVSDTESTPIIWDMPIVELPTPIRDGYTFAGWYTQEGNCLTSDSSFSEVDDLYVTAYWQSEWVLEEDVPSDCDISNTKWTYDELVTVKTENQMGEGYSFVGTEKTYTQYGEWSEWSHTAATSNELTNVETRTAYPYYFFECPNCGAHMHGSVCYTWAGGCGSTSMIWNEFYLPYSYSDLSFGNWYGTGVHYANTVERGIVFKWLDAPSSSATQYRYQERSICYLNVYTTIEAKESFSYVTAENNISNVQKWVQYIIK